MATGNGQPHNPTGSTSRSLLVRARDQDSEAWNRLVELYAPLVVHWCRKLDVPEHDLSDVVQDVFEAVARKLGDFRKDRESDTFRGWLRVIARNKVIDSYRNQQRQPAARGGTEAMIRMSQVPADALESEDDARDEETAQQMLFHRALQLIQHDFEERTWKAFWRVVVDGCTPKDVGEELDMKPGTVRVAKSRVLHRLRRELGDLLE